MLGFVYGQSTDRRSEMRAPNGGCGMRWFGIYPALIFAAIFAATAQAAPVSVQLGNSVVPLDAPWKFHTGDDARWASAGFDDTHWETFDLTPKAGAHDGDVGLKGYVAGWNARGHRNYSG